MGWKSIKEHYRIGHSVHVTDEGICIGSPYVHNLIVIGRDGEVKKRETFANGDLARYLNEFDADPEKLKSLVNARDTFERSITVYTYEGGRIIEKQCEEPGWPNVTHDGQLMYENTFSTDRTKVVQWARKNLEIGIRWSKERLEELRKQISEVEQRLAKDESELKELTSK